MPAEKKRNKKILLQSHCRCSSQPSDAIIAHTSVCQAMNEMLDAESR